MATRISHPMHGSMHASEILTMMGNARCGSYTVFHGLHKAAMCSVREMR